MTDLENSKLSLSIESIQSSDKNTLMKNKTPKSDRNRKYDYPKWFDFPLPKKSLIPIPNIQQKHLDGLEFVI